LINLRERCAATKGEVESLRGLLEALPFPVWLRDASGRLEFVNCAYAQAVEAKDAEEVLAKQIELLDQSARAATAEARSKSRMWRERVNAVVAGARHLLDVIQAPSARSAAAIAIDRQEIETVRADLETQMLSHRRTLDQMPSAVAIFDGSQQLIYRNAAYEKLWLLDPAFLDGRPPTAKYSTACGSNSVCRWNGTFARGRRISWKPTLDRRASLASVAPAGRAHDLRQGHPEPEGWRDLSL